MLFPVCWFGGTRTMTAACGGRSSNRLGLVGAHFERLSQSITYSINLVDIPFVNKSCIVVNGQERGRLHLS